MLAGTPPRRGKLKSSHLGSAIPVPHCPSTCCRGPCYRKNKKQNQKTTSLYHPKGCNSTESWTKDCGPCRHCLQRLLTRHWLRHLGFLRAHRYLPTSPALQVIFFPVCKGQATKYLRGTASCFVEVMHLSCCSDCTKAFDTVPHVKSDEAMSRKIVRG